ncbi:MAG TPA: hypothetical protein VMV72_10985 [Verrucomicrobiae bacterium]|nr:hypothetical protein [Verrucomicrobiae bacterium]
MNEIAASVSRLPDAHGLCLPALGSHWRPIFCCTLSAVAVLLAVTTRRDADRLPVQALAPVVSVRAAPVARHPQPSPSAIAPEAAARNAILRPAAPTISVRNRFEPEPSVDTPKPVPVVYAPSSRAFSGPMWRFLLNEPVRPDIDLTHTHNQTYYGVKVTLPLGG